MKFIILFILIITLNQIVDYNQTFAQTIHLDSIAVITESGTTDTVDVRLMVMNQIKQAQLKSELEAKQLSEVKDSSNLAEQFPLQTEKKDSTVLTSQLPANPEVKNEAILTPVAGNEVTESNGLDFKFAVISGAALLAVGFVSIRRIKFTKKSGTNTLKKNINLMREEKFVRAADKKLSQLRSKLRMNAEYLANKENSVSLTAKDLNISKGEIMLAAKIKSFELSKSCSPRQ